MRPAHSIPGLPPEAPRAPESAERLAAPPAPRAGPRSTRSLALCRLAADPDLALAGVERYVDGAGELPADRDLLEALVLLCRLLADGAGAARARPAPPPPRRPLAASSRRPRDEADLRRLLARAVRRLDPDDVAGFLRLLRRVRARGRSSASRCATCAARA